jgi:hypothetical protein
MPVVRLACSPDSPQGLLKKIQFQLLLAELALQRNDSLARSRKIPHPLCLHGRINLNRSRSLERAMG